MKPEESDNIAGSDCREQIEKRFDDIQSVLEDARTHIMNQEVGRIKGECWKAAVGCLIEKFGIKDETIPDKVNEYFRIAMEEAAQSDEIAAFLQDALMEFRSEYKRIIA